MYLLFNFTIYFVGIIRGHDNTYWFLNVVFSTERNGYYMYVATTKTTHEADEYRAFFTIKNQNTQRPEFSWASTVLSVDDDAKYICTDRLRLNEVIFVYRY